MTTHKRPVGSIATVLDPATLLKYGREALKKRSPGADPVTLQHGPLPQMLLPVQGDRIAVVNGEGVGEIAKLDDTVEVTFSYGYVWLQLKLTLEQISEAATAEAIDLADGIRTFGARLDSNHYTWHRMYDQARASQPSRR